MCVSVCSCSTVRACITPVMTDMHVSYVVRSINAATVAAVAAPATTSEYDDDIAVSSIDAACYSDVTVRRRITATAADGVITYTVRFNDRAALRCIISGTATYSTIPDIHRDTIIAVCISLSIYVCNVWLLRVVCTIMTPRRRVSVP